MSEQSTVRIYLMAGRKQWHHKLPEGWREVAWERFDYIECGIFEKLTDGLTNEDRDLLVSYGERPEGWIEPK